MHFNEQKKFSFCTKKFIEIVHNTKIIDKTTRTTNKNRRKTKLKWPFDESFIRSVIFFEARMFELFF